MKRLVSVFTFVSGVRPVLIPSVVYASVDGKVNEI